MIGDIPGTNTIAAGWTCPTCYAWVPNGMTHFCHPVRIVDGTEPYPVPPVTPWPQPAPSVAQLCPICGYIHGVGLPHVSTIQERLTEIERILKRLEEKYLDD